MTDLTDLEQELTTRLTARAGSVSPPSDAWQRLTAELADEPTGGAAVAEDLGDLRVLDDEQPGERGRLGRRRWPIAVIGAAAAAVVIIVVLLSLGGGDEETIFTDDQEEPDSELSVEVGPGSWSVAATFTDPAVAQDLGSSVVAEVRSWPGVIDVAVVADDPAAWTASTGLDSAVCGEAEVAPPCGSGVAVLTVDASMVQTAMRLEREFGMTPLTAVDVPREFMEGYLDAAIESASPVPLGFDPSSLGVEQPLTGPLTEYEGEPSICEPDSCVVAVEGHVDGDVTSVGLGVTESEVDGFGVGTQFGGAAAYYVEELLVGRSGRGGVLGESVVVEGRRVYWFAGLPLEAAVVGFVQGDGSAVWQRPLAGLAMIVDAPGTGVGLEPGGADPPPAGPFVVLDAAGAEIMRIVEIGGPPLVEDFRVELANAFEPVPPGATESGVEVTTVATLDGLLYGTAVGGNFVETGDAVWLFTDLEPYGEGGSQIVRIDTASGEVDYIPLDGFASTMVPTADALWVNINTTLAHSSDVETVPVSETGTVMRIDLESRAVTDTIEVSDGQSGRDLIAADGGLWVIQTAGLLRIDLATQAIETFPGVGDRWVGEIDGGLWAFGGHVDADPPCLILTRVDFDTGAIERYELDRVGPDETCVYSHETGVIAADDSIWLRPLPDQGWLTRFDVASREITDRLSHGQGAVGYPIAPMAFAQQALWITNPTRGTITRIDATSAEVTDVIIVEPGAVDVSVWGGSLWVSHPDSGVVSRIDMTTRQVADVISAASGRMLSVPADGAVWTVADDGTVSRIGIDP